MVSFCHGWLSQDIIVIHGCRVIFCHTCMSHDVMGVTWHHFVIHVHACHVVSIHHRSQPSSALMWVLFQWMQVIIFPGILSSTTSAHPQGTLRQLTSSLLAPETISELMSSEVVCHKIITREDDSMPGCSSLHLEMNVDVPYFFKPP